MKPLQLILLVVLLVAGLILLLASAFVVNADKQVVVTQFGKPVGSPITEPGLHFRIPFVQTPNYFEKRYLSWDGDPNRIPTKDKRFIYVDTYARWNIVDPLLFFQRLRDVQKGRSRLDDILDGEARNTIAKHDLIEVVRQSNREFAQVQETGAEVESGVQVPKVTRGRSELAKEVLANANKRTEGLGVQILDFRFKRINYEKEVQKEVFNRMISERQRIAERYRSEGQGEAARINGERERELRLIQSEAYRKVQEIKGQADAEAADIYAQAYSANAEFYRLLRTLETYRGCFDSQTTLLLTTEAEFLNYLQSSKIE